MGVQVEMLQEHHMALSVEHDTLLNENVLRAVDQTVALGLGASTSCHLEQHLVHHSVAPSPSP